MDNQIPNNDATESKNASVDAESLPVVNEAALGDPGSSMPQITPGSDDPTALASSSLASVQLPDEAADTDIIEKEWVERAKQIVDQTSNDPYLQQQEIGKVKSDYLKKRYNKEIKLSD